MDRKDEYHDPDYAGTSENVKEEPRTLSEEERIEKIRKIIRREFSNELEVRENEVMMLDQRMSTSRRLLQRLRYALVSGYYRAPRLQLGAEHDTARDHADRARTEMSSILREGQRRLHPSVRKLLGKRTVDLSEIFKTRQPRSRPRRDYSAMLQIRNYTIAADSTKSLRPATDPQPGPDPAPDQPRDQTRDPTPHRPRKQPRHLEPRVDNVLTLDEQTRNKVKHRYRIVIGNTSKYAPPASRADRSTHKWLLYVREYCPPSSPSGPPREGGVGAIVKSVTARLHHSYAPHHTVTLHKPPFHISRRGWGEFTARLELGFALPELNPPASLAHTIKLDRNYTGLQTLGAETIVDVWLYSSPEMIPHSYQDSNDQPLPDTNTDRQTDAQSIKQEPLETLDNDSWMEFFARDSGELDVDEMIIRPVKAEPELTDTVPDIADMEVEPHIKEEPMDFEENLIRDVPTETVEPPVSPKKRIMKYIDPTTGKIYYLEMDRNLDLSTVQEIVINNSKETKKSPVKNGVNVKKKKGISLLKPEVKNSLRTEQMNASYRHIENDHCYLGYGWLSKSKENCDSVVESVSDCGESRLVYLRTCLSRLSDVRSSVYFLLRNIPLVDARASDQDYQKWFPFVVDSEHKYWKLDFAKRRNIEWSRAKLITRLLSELPAGCERPWSSKQVLAFGRLHGLHPSRPQPPVDNQSDCSGWGELHSRNESNIKELYRASDINSLSVFNSESFKSEVTEIDLVDSDDEIDIVGSDRVRAKVRGGSESCEGLRPLPQTEEERLRFLFVEKVCADIGIELRNEDVGNGYSYSAVHCVLLSAMRSFAEELVRTALAAARLGADAAPTVWSSSRGVINLEHVYQAAGGAPPSEGGGGGGGGAGAVAGRLALLSARGRAARRQDTTAAL